MTPAERLGLKKDAKGVFDYFDMRDHVADAYKIDERDYAGHFAFDWVETATSRGVDATTAKILYETPPASLSEPLARIHEEINLLKSEYQSLHPYQDFWHFLLKYFDRNGGFHKNVILRLNWYDVLKAAKTNWQLEIALFYVTEFGKETYRVAVDW